MVERYLPAADGYQKTVLDAMNYSVRAGGKRLRPMLMGRHVGCLAAARRW